MFAAWTDCCRHLSTAGHQPRNRRSDEDEFASYTIPHLHVHLMIPMVVDQRHGVGGSLLTIDPEAQDPPTLGLRDVEVDVIDGFVIVVVDLEMSPAGRHARCKMKGIGLQVQALHL